ncbi:MAG: aldo/keto reductase, partial [Terrimicrobiaceae bacterium]|nr:aldo/keto reductase [Terrimicrobiaceae bacterium]
MVGALPRRRFGRTGLAMPVLSCGGMRYQQLWEDAGWDKVSADNQRNLEATIHRALELGINHIETARGYGTSELQLGKVLPHLPRESLIVQTKVAPAPAPDFLKTFSRSLDLLGLEHVDLLALHGINNLELLDLSLRRGGALEAARQIQREGRARFVGFSTHAECEVIVRTLAPG